MKDKTLIEVANTWLNSLKGTIFEVTGELTTKELITIGNNVINKNMTRVLSEENRIKYKK